MPLPNPVIVLPGITASELRDEYPVSPEALYTAVVNQDYDRIMLHPDDLRYERTEPARVRATAVFSVPYEELILELRHNLTPQADKPVPVYPFAYDWRQPLERIEAVLADFVQEVIDRTKLMKHYDRDGYADNPRVNFVAHSMGGLVLSGYLATVGKKAPVGKVATLGTPFRGSYEAPLKVLTGTASLGTGESSSREREAARVTPGLYHLLPRFPNAVTDEKDRDVDLYSADSWQQGVIDTLAEFIRLNSVNPPGNKSDRQDKARKLLDKMLSQAAAHRDRIDGLKLANVGLTPKEWLCLVGVDQVTRVGLTLNRSGSTPRFDLSSDQRANEWSGNGNRARTGDGVVPFPGACPQFLDPKNLVCVSPGDLGYWEVGDRVLAGSLSLHAVLPKVNLVHRLIVAHFKDLNAAKNDSLWGRRAPGVASGEWQPPIANLNNKDSESS